MAGRLDQTQWEARHGDALQRVPVGVGQRVGAGDELHPYEPAPRRQQDLERIAGGEPVDVEQSEDTRPREPRPVARAQNRRQHRLVRCRR
jgi:hypothetical protein